MIEAANLRDLPRLVHGFGLRDTAHPATATTVRQVHSAMIREAGDRAGEQIGEGDALIANRLGITVGIKTADCVPILLADPVTGSVAAIHAGWRGTAANITTRVVEELAHRWKVAPGNIRAAIGPSIGGCCYEVSAEVASRFGTWVADLKQVNQAVRIDLAGINEIQLRKAGVEDIWISGECTFCGPPDRFFSFRREKEEAGRMMSFIGRV